MIPTLSIDETLKPAYRDFLDALREAGFAGDIARDYASRLTMATDNGIFQQTPQAVLFPREEDDLARIMTTASRREHRGVRLAPRGGGTSTIGCSLTAGIVVDCSRHMNNIVAIDAERQRVRVQPGVVLDQLNDRLAAHGLFFAPNVAPSSRATLGGMASTDGCGKGSRVHGKTSDHVLASRLVLCDGTVHKAAPLDQHELAGLQARNDAAGEIHREVAAVITEKRDRIDAVFPRLQRYLSGYNLAQVLDGDGRFNLNKLICGSEGTLALVAELTLKLTPLPAAKTLFALRYRSFDEALADAQTLVTFEPGAIESLDDNVMGLARNNPIYERVRDYIEQPDGSTPGAVNLVEFAAPPGQSLDEITAPFQTFLQAQTGAGGESRASGCYRADAASAQAALWELRKSGVGLLGSKAGKRKPLPFVEDTVVDPAVLADYVRDFRAILDAHNLEYGMFGHIDVGCLHVRPALDLCDPDDERILRAVMDQVEALVRRYGGLVWNEHGKGFRSQYNPDYFGPELYAALARIKRAFDPHNQLNPGKIVAMDDGPPLAAMNAATRGSFDRQIDPRLRQAYPTTVTCNGNGACFSYDPREVMCPSYRVTRDRLHSPKGRATIMREWLRQHSLQQSDLSGEHPRPRSLLRHALTDARRRLRAIRRRRVQDDFSHEVWQAMDGCLSCRACASQCPVKVDVPDFKTRFLALYHGRYARPWSDYAVTSMESTIAIVAHLSGLYNAVSRSRVVRRSSARWLGLSDMPALSRPGLSDFLRAHPEHAFTPKRYWALGAESQGRCVFIVQDAFTTFFDAGVIVSVVRLLKRFGYHPMVLPYRPNGKPLQVKGFETEFRRIAGHQARWLADIARLGPPLLGVEPSVTLTYRQEYPAALGRDAVPFRVQLLEEWLVAEVAGKRTPRGKSHGVSSYTLFQHCTAAANLPGSANAWRRVFEFMGLRLAQAHVGCCGMSGAYGHETRHQAESIGIFSLSWSEALAAAGRDGGVVVPGYSCRSQIRRLRQTRPPHPAQVLLAHCETPAQSACAGHG